MITKQTRDGWSINAEEAVVKKLGFKKDTYLDSDRVIQMLGEQTALILQIEKIIRATWNELSPKSPLSLNNELITMVEKFLSGDPDVSRSQVADELENTRRLTAAMVAAIGRLGRVLSENLSRQFSPAVIEQASRQDKRWHEGVEVASWRLYKERAVGLDESELDREVRKLLVDYTESVARGMR